MSYFGNIQEEELKLKVGETFFGNFDHTVILGKVDFTVAEKLPQTHPTPVFMIFGSFSKVATTRAS
jgi:hypothetical protein